MHSQTVYSWPESAGIRVRVEFNDSGSGRSAGYVLGQFCAQVLIEGCRATEYTERYSGDPPSEEKLRRVGRKALEQWQAAVADGMVDVELGW